MNLPSLPEPLRRWLPRPRLPRRRGPLIALGAGALIALLTVTGVLPALASIAPPLPDVLIRKLALDLAFGPPPPQEEEDVTIDGPPIEVDVSVPTPRIIPAEPVDPLPPLDLPDPVVVPCNLDTSRPVFPKDPLSTSVAGQPGAGTYTWRHEGEFTIGTGDAAITAPLMGFTERRITDLVTTDGAFTYTYHSRFTFFRQIERIRVAPGDGIYLERLERRSAKDEPFLVFEPLTPVRIISLPIPLTGLQAHSLVEGAIEDNLDDPDDPDDPYDQVDEARRTESSSGIDPVNRVSLAVRSVVTGQDRINACGHLTDAYLIGGTRTFNRDATSASADNPDTGQAIERFELAIAPQLGALLVRERFVTETPGFIGPLPYTLDATFTAGTLAPDDGTDGQAGEPEPSSSQPVRGGSP